MASDHGQSRRSPISRGVVARIPSCTDPVPPVQQANQGGPRTAGASDHAGINCGAASLYGPWVEGLAAFHTPARWASR